MLGGAVLFRGERKGEQLRAKERAGVSGKEARGGADNGRQLMVSRAKRRPTATMRRPCPGAARRSSGRDQKPDSAISKLPNS